MPTYKPRQVLRELKKKGCIQIKNDNGSHQKVYNPKTNMTTTVAVHLGQDIDRGTLKEIYKQLGLQFDL